LRPGGALQADAAAFEYEEVYGLEQTRFLRTTRNGRPLPASHRRAAGVRRVDLRPSVAARLHKGSISGSAEGAGELGSRRVSNWSPQRIYAYVGLGHWPV